MSVDILPEGAIPGTPSNPAPTSIPHPSRLGARGTQLTYIDLPGLIELKLAAGRARDESDVVELLRANPDQVDAVRKHLTEVNKHYVTRFQELLVRAKNKPIAERQYHKAATGAIRHRGGTLRSRIAVVGMFALVDMVG